jgi:3-methylfumaryl-CoA hydratase
MARGDDWIGRSRTRGSLLDPWPATALHASLGLLGDGVTRELPLLWQWLYFLETPRRAEQGPDGHPRKGEFLPPIANPRRMFVGGRTEVHAPLQLGRAGELTERIVSCQEKQGSNGPMTLLTLGFDYRQDGRLCVSEERDFMYLPARERAQAEQRVDTESPVPSADWEWDVDTDPVLLFKFSALTFNGHRIHYDRDYARDKEAYPDIVVHGPLTALLLAELARSHTDRRLRQFSFRAVAPLYVGDRLRLRGQPAGESITLTAYRPDGTAAMTAEAK